ncbi:MAG: hypothetical protein OHK006_22650 [Thermodesulfovibrionales bacterium]
MTSAPALSRSYLDDGAVPDARTSRLLLGALVSGLLIDRLLPLWGQVIAGVMTWGLFLWLYRTMPAPAKRLLMSCLVVATMGEIFCSLVWQLYDYRLLSIPFYVPPGHVLVFLLGSGLAQRMPHSVVRIVPLCMIPCAVLGFALGFDEFGIVLFAMFLACLIAEKDRRLYATMFLLCLLLEIFGTLLGNWRWKETVPFWGLSTTNPPVSAGTFYCLLDFLMLRLVLAADSLGGFFTRQASLCADFVRSLTGPAAPGIPAPVESSEKKLRMPAGAGEAGRTKG